MGNFLHNQPKTPYDRNVLLQLKEKKIDDIMEAVQIINTDYADTQCVDYQQFDDIFCFLMDDTEPFFVDLQNDHDIDGTVDIYESMAALVIFCGDQFENKAKFIFQMFDFDQNESLEIHELVLTLQSACRGLCKLVHIEVPTLAFLEDLSQSIFGLIDHDNNQRITFEEFTFWIEHSDDLQDFLLKYAQTQTFKNMKRRYSVLVTVFEHFFNNASGGKDKETASLDELIALLLIDGKKYFREDDRDFLSSVLLDSSVFLSNGMITKENRVCSRIAYTNIMKCWAAFQSSDINNDNSVNVTELRTLLWVFEDEEPSDKRVENEMIAIDSDKSGCINRYEWINNFCSADKNGKMVFRANLRQLFEKYDKDNSGTLNLEEVKLLTVEAFEGYLARAKNAEDQATLKEMIDQLSKEVFEELDDGEDKQLQWEEFKEYMEVAMGKQDKLKRFLDMNFEG